MPRYKRKNKTVNWIVLLVLVIFILVFRLYDKIDHDIKPDARFNVVRVIDGDTIELSGGDKLRLLSIDTPEKNEPYYEKAKNFVKRIALNNQAVVEYSSTRRDKYGRLLGYLYIDTFFVNKHLLDSGYACLYLFRDNELDRDETKQLLSAQQDAIRHIRGIWSEKKVSEQYYIAKDNSFRLHRPGCKSVENLVEGRYSKFNNRLDAFMIGLSPCRNCQP